MADPIRDLLLSDSGDLAVVNGDFAKVGGADAVPQAIQVKVGMMQGEVWLDESVGFPWLQEVYDVKNPDKVAISQQLADKIASVPDVTKVVGTELEVDSATRDATVSYTVRTVYSSEDLSGDAAGP